MKTFAATVALVAVFATAAYASVTVTPINTLQRGTMVTVQGTVERITDEDEFRLADATGRVRIYVGPNWVPADVGEAVTVNGFVDDDLGPLEIYARNLTRADGSVITFQHRYE
ncbi:NirD/YgiW/YdeI family stress tolerance protein [Aestuariibius sp. 2305UL40-4]|uniref:NirD/YgiW/YdeI family stress tolerance protein n=1 Tax=Aestuariibius violaceus TaxID=3234132 RepID=UPI00345E87B4